MKLAIIAKRLEDAGVAVRGQDLFIGFFPATVTRGVLLKAPLTGTMIHHELPGYHCTKFGVIVRHHVIASGETLADAVQDALTVEQRTVWSDGPASMHINQCLPETLPIVYPWSEGNSVEWSLNFDISYVRQP